MNEESTPLWLSSPGVGFYNHILRQMSDTDRVAMEAKTSHLQSLILQIQADLEERNKLAVTAANQQQIPRPGGQSSDPSGSIKKKRKLEFDVQPGKDQRTLEEEEDDDSDPSSELDDLRSVQRKEAETLGKHGSSCRPRETPYTGIFPPPDQEPGGAQIEIKLEEEEAPQQQHTTPQVIEAEENLPEIFKDPTTYEYHFNVPQQKSQDPGFKAGSRVRSVKVKLVAYTRRKRRFLCLYQAGIPYFVPEDQIKLRLNWEPMRARCLSEATSLAATDLEKAYTLDREFRGKVPTAPEVETEYRPLEIYDVSGDVAAIPTAWINWLKAPVLVKLKDDSPFKWWIQQCLRWSRLVNAVAAGQEGISPPKAIDMFFRYRPNKPLETKQIYISFAKCFENMFGANGASAWLRDHFLVHKDPGGRLKIRVLDRYHDSPPAMVKLSKDGDEYTIWSHHPRDLYRTWMKTTDIKDLSSESDYRSYDDFRPADLFPKIKDLLNDPDSTLRGSSGTTLTCVSEPKYSSAGKREGDQSSKMNGVSATAVAMAVYKSVDAPRENWQGVAEWLHRSGYQMGGFGVEAFFHDPQSSQSRFNFVFGTKNANTVMLRYETWARRFSSSWWANQYPDPSKRPNFTSLAYKYGLMMGDRTQYRAIYNKIPLGKGDQMKLDAKLINLHKQKYKSQLSEEEFAPLPLEIKRAKLRKWGIAAQEKGDWSTDADRHAFKWLCHAKNQAVVHSHLETTPTVKSEQFVMDLYSEWYAKVAAQKSKTKLEPTFTGKNFWPTPTLDKIVDRDIIAYHKYQAFARFGWIMPELRWKFTAPWTDHTNLGQVLNVVVDTEFNLFSKRLPFQIEAKLDGVVDELWYQMMTKES